MATQITPGATADQVGQRQQTIRGKLAGNRQLRGVALIAVLVLTLAASLALGRALGSDQAGSAVSLPSVGDGPGFTASREEHQSAAAASMPGFASFREDHRAVVGPAYTFPEVYGDDEASAMRSAPTTPGYLFPEVYGDDEASAPRGVPIIPVYEFPAVYGDDEAR